MRVALVTETFPPEVNGVARTLRELVAGVEERGDRVEVVRPRRDDLPAADAAAQVLVPGAPLPGYPTLRFGFFCPRRLLSLWRRARPDVVHVATEGPLGLAALLAARRLGLPIISTFHTNFHLYGRFYGFGLLRRLGLAYLRWFHRRTALTLTPGGSALATLSDLGFVRLRPLGRGVDGDLFHPGRRSPELRRAWGAAQNAPVLAYVGRLAPEKNLGLALRAFTAARRKVPGARVVLVGDGPERAELEAHHPDFVFAGLRRGEDLAAHYASADILVFPSRTETFGNVVTEGMASGLAVIAFAEAAAGLHVTSGTNGVTVAPGADDGLVGATVELARRPGEWRRLGEAARRTAEGITWERQVEVFRDCLEEAVTAGRHPGQRSSASNHRASDPPR